MLIRKQLRQSPRRQYWFEKLMALLALLNLGLVVFDISYIPYRDLYLRHFPELTRWYGEQFKGIEPHRDTEAYLGLVENLEEQVTETGLRSPEVEALLTELQGESARLIDENPFELVNKSGTLERIKNEMRDRLDTESSKQAFATFWSRDYLSRATWNQEIEFFNSTIRPLIQSNYYRNLSETGGFVDEFWKIDLWFVAVFGAEFLARTFYLSRRYRGVNWLDTMMWRWYDLLFLVVAFTPSLRWLRVIPVTIRLNRSRLLNLEPIRTRINHGLVASFAVELTEIVVLRIIEQSQSLIREGSITRWLLKPEQRYVDINGIDEVEAIANRLVTVLVQQVLPKVKPDVEALIQHSLNRALQQLPIYSGLQHIPGLSHLPDQLTQQVAADVSSTAYQALAASLEDVEGAKLVRRLAEHLGNTFKAELQQDHTLEEIESLVNVLLDEIKLNYVKQVAKEDIEKLREQTHQLYKITQTSK